jgi:hypothetical protein
MRQFKPTLKLNETQRTSLLLVLALALILLLSAVSQIIPQRTPGAWKTPMLANSTPKPSPVPGWWSNLPTAVPLSASPTPTR